MLLDDPPTISNKLSRSVTVSAPTFGNMIINAPAVARRMPSRRNRNNPLQLRAETEYTICTSPANISSQPRSTTETRVAVVSCAMAAAPSPINPIPATIVQARMYSNVLSSPTRLCALIDSEFMSSLLGGSQTIGISTGFAGGDATGFSNESYPRTMGSLTG
jgi:hypothetical protein